MNRELIDKYPTTGKIRKACLIKITGGIDSIRELNEIEL